MKALLVYAAVILFGATAFGQLRDLNLTNALVVSHIKNPEDRFSLEVALAETLAQNGIKNNVSLNMVKTGGDSKIIMNDSVIKKLASQGINTVIVVSVRGYDRNYAITNRSLTLAEDLAADNLFTLYKEDIVSISFEFHFYREGKMVGADIIKIGSISSRDGVLKKLRKKLNKRIIKKWK